MRSRRNTSEISPPCATFIAADFSVERGHLLRLSRTPLFIFLSFLLLQTFTLAQDAPVDPTVAPPPHARTTHLKHLLVIGQTKGWEHDSVTDAMAAIYNMGHDSGLWDAMLRTDTELITKKDLGGRNTKNLDYFDALIFVSTTGELDLDEGQKKDMLTFIKD
jgi:hypothetical protein